ncbi:response regulator, partial [Desulfovibrio sp. OttesenSCG-928-G15]|nr:response regulator [Desulfovibrio sp. OttesenSCG-928-G15]
SIIWALDRGQVVEHDEDGQTIRLLGVLQDITAEKKASLDMEISKNQMEMILSEVKFGTWDWDLESGRVNFDNTFFSMLGYNKHEVPSTVALWENLLHPEDKQRADIALDELREGRSDAYETELRIRHKDGHYVWVYDMGRAVNKGEDGKPARVVGGQLDIDRRIRQEQEQKIALETIARQKAVLEQTVLERTELLRNIRNRVDAIAADTAHTDTLLPPVSGAKNAAPELPAGQASLPGLPDRPGLSGLSDWSGMPEPTDARGSHDVPGIPGMPSVIDEAHFAQSLGRAFDVITDKMWWYKAVIDSIPFPIYVTDMNERWTYLNAPALSNIGASSLGAVLGQKAVPWGEEQPPSRDAAGYSGARAKAIYRYNPERKRFFQGQASYLLDKSGRSIGHIEAMQDVTKMHEADQRTRIMLDTTPLACNFWNDKIECVDSNHAAVVLFKVKNKQEYMQRFFELMPPYQPDGSESVPTAQELIRRTFAEGYVRFEWMFALPDKTPMPAEITIVRVEHDGKPIALGYIRDLTELKAKTAEVDRERQLLTKIMDSSPVCFVILVHNKVRFATPYAKEFFGIREGSDIQEFYTEKEERERLFAEVRETGVVNWRVVSMRSADGAPKEMLANAFMAEYFAKPCVMSWFLDVTEMRETERQLRLARDAAEESTKAKGEFLANMSHEIRTPMNAILGMTRLVLDTSLSERQRSYLEKAEQSARTLLRIINDILDFSKIEAGKLEMEETDFLLRDILQAVLDMFRTTAEQKQLAFTLDVQAVEPLFLRGDPLRLHQVLINLVGNAFKFTSRGGITITVMEMERSPHDLRLGFSVKDTGIGLEREKADKLFTAFSQADTSTTRRFGGTGLGLAISKRLVEMMHGDIRCVSEPGKGTDFRFSALFRFAENEQGIYLPGTTETAHSANNTAEAAVSHLAGKSILVAEDNEINQIVIREMLEKAGFIVDIANDGREAVEMTLENQYDLVFMDIQMPRMDGLTATTALRKHEHLRTLPIIAMTAHAMVGDKERSLSVGMNAHVTKPIDPDEVFGVIARWLGS